MNYDEIKRVQDDFTKSPKKTVITIAIFIVISVITFIFRESIIGVFTNDTPNVTQSSSGNQSPNLNISGNVSGDVNISINDLNNQIKDLEAVRNTTPEGKTYTTQELLNRMQEIRLARSFGSAQKEAQSDATNFLDTLPLRLEASEQKRQDYKSFLEALPQGCNIVFNDFLIPYIDNYFGEFKDDPIALEHGLDHVEIEKLADIDPMFAESNNGYPIRLIKFPNGCYIKINFNPGVIGEGRLSRYPSMRIVGFDIENKSIENAKFDVENSVATMVFGGGNSVGYPTPSKNGAIGDDFYKGLNPLKSNFQKHFESIILRIVEYDQQ